MENIIYNELQARKYHVDAGMVIVNQKDKLGRSIRKHLEVDFVCNMGSKRYDIQSAFAIPDQEKLRQEEKKIPFSALMIRLRKS